MSGLNKLLSGLITIINIYHPLTTVPYATEYIDDSKIRVVLDSIYFYTDPTTDSAYYYANNNYGHNILLDSFISANYPERTKALNIHLTGAVYPGAGGYSDYGSIESFYQHNPEMDTSDVHDYWFGEHWAHEIGHSFDLWHTYNFNPFYEQNCNISDFDFLWDVYDTTLTCSSSGCNICLIPCSSTNNNLMGGGDNTHISALQMGIIHRSAMMENFHNHNYGIRDHITGYSQVPYEITKDEVWDFSMKFYQNIIVRTGYTLTIKCEIQFVPEAKIIVEPGAKLIIDGGKLTTEKYFDQLWQGIEVWGDKDLSQVPISNQGYVYINGGTIENAREAVMLWHPDDWNSMGGIIEAYGSNFLNNTRSVAFMMYQNTFNGHPFRNLSSFKNCTFNINDDYRVPIINDFGTHVTLWAVNGVTFTGCNFLNEQTHKAYDMTQNQAIYSMDAGYNIGSSCDATNIYNGSCPPESLKRSYFKGFNTAVHAYGSSSGNVVKIDEAVFEDNVRGVEFDAFNYSWVNRSKFSIGNISIEGSPDYQEGIFTNKSWGFRIEENLLHPSLNSTPMSIGIRIRDSEKTDNQIYKDTLKGLYIANRAEGRNRGGNINGLQILCNDQSYNNTDISVVPLASFDQGIRLNQGDNNTSTAAGNLFSHLTMDIDNSLFCSPIKYFYTNTYAQNPTLITANVYTAIANNTNTCPSYINIGHNSPLAAGTKFSLTEEYDVQETMYLNLLYNYNNLIDGGNTNLLLNKIEMSWPEDAWELRAELISKSPYLSEETLKKAAVKGVLPQAMLLEICLANPDATKAINFINFLVDSIPNPLPGYMIGLIKVNWEANTVRTLLEGNLANVSSRMALISNLMISDCMLDSVIQKQEVRNWLNRRGGINDYYSLTESYIEDNNYELATEYLEQIPILFSLNKDDNAEYDNFVEFLNFRSRISGREKTIMQLDSLEIETLQEIADNNTGRSSVMAQNILCFGYKRCKDYLVVESEEEKHLISNFSSKEAASNYNKIKVTPNPASVYVAFSWEFPLLEGSALLIINDNSGKSIEQKTISTKNGQWIWDTREINNGVYYYQVKSDGQDFCAGKVIVSK